MLESVYRYWNLGGHDSGDVLGHEMMLNAPHVHSYGVYIYGVYSYGVYSYGPI